MKAKTLLCILATFMCIAVSYAELRKDDGFWYDDSLKEAQNEISQMQSEELEAFISFFATCNFLSEKEPNQFCQRDKNLFVIKYQRDRVVDIFVSSLLIHYQIKLFAKETRRDEHIAIIQRYLFVRKALESAARARYQTLNYSKIWKNP
jgi:hypothetical protein